jgi:hypothetical protein
LVSCNLKSGVLFLEGDLKLVNTTCGFGKFVKTVVDVLFLNINSLEFLNVDVLVHVDERKI